MVPPALRSSSGVTSSWTLRLRNCKLNKMLSITLMQTLCYSPGKREAPLPPVKPSSCQVEPPVVTRVRDFRSGASGQDEDFLCGPPWKSHEPLWVWMPTPAEQGPSWEGCKGCFSLSVCSAMLGGCSSRKVPSRWAAGKKLTKSSLSCNACSRASSSRKSSSSPHTHPGPQEHLTRSPAGPPQKAWG